MLSIRPFAIEGLDCLENSLLTIIKWKYNEFEQGFVDSFYFSYKQECGKRMGESLSVPTDNVINNFKKYYGLSIGNIDFDKSDPEKVIRNEIEAGNPVMISMDTFFCNWYENYKKSHSVHVFIITGKIERGWSVIDTMPLRFNIQISEEDLKSGLRWIRKVNWGKRTEAFPSIYEVISKVLERKCKRNELQQIEMFIKDFSGSDIESEIDENCDVWSIPLLNNMRRVYGSYNQLLLLLNYMKKSEKSIGDYYIDIVKPIVSEWGIIINLMYKMKMNQKYVEMRPRIICRLKKVYELEKLMLKQIELEGNRQRHGADKRTCRYENISFPFNNESHFFQEKDYTLESEFRIGERWEAETVIFDFPMFGANELNSISCDGQHIEIGHSNVLKIHFIGYAKWGNQMENVTIEYSESSEEKELAITDWCYEPRFGENVIWEGDFAQIHGTEIYKGKIFDVGIPVQDTWIRQLILPKCSKIVLFAIVLEIEEG